MAENKDLKCCDKSLEFILVKGDSWQAYKPETATCSKCKTYYERKPGKDFEYKQVGGKEGGYVCTSDSQEIMGARVAHPIWDGPFPMSGSGRCEYETVPYCSKHEQKPDFHGTPIEVGQKFR